MEENTNETAQSTEDNITQEQVVEQTTENKVETEDTAQEVTEEQTTEVQGNEDLTNCVADEYLQEKGFNYDELQQEFMSQGNLSPETREKLVRAGIPEEAIDAHISAFSIQAEKVRDEVASVVGSRDELESVIKWAGENLDTDEITAINSVTDLAVMKIIVKDLKSRMEDLEGVTPDYVTGSAGVVTTNLYESKQQMMDAINDPRYSKDEAYRKKVGEIISASRAAGVLDY